MTGWTIGRCGRKRLLLLSVTGFTVSSFLCGLAPTLPFLIVCRVIQGAHTAAACNHFRRPSCWNHFLPRNADKRWRSGRWASLWGRCWDLSPEAASPTITVGAECSTSTYPSAWGRQILTQIFCLRSALFTTPENRHRLLGNRLAGRGHRQPADHARQRPGGQLVRLALHCHALRADGC